MRFVTFQSEAAPRLGLVRGESVVTLPGQTMQTLIEAGYDATRPTGELLPLNTLTLLAPLPTPRRNVFCIGMNYAAHAAESLRAKGAPIVMPKVPVFFTKATTAVNAPYGDIPVHPNLSPEVDWEVELAVIIGKPGKNIKRDQAMEHVFGYTVLNDVSARDIQNSHGGQFFKGKSLDGSCPMGPWIVTTDEIPNPHNLPLRCWVNGVLKQESNTADFIFNIPAMLEWLSRGMTLLPGDILTTGTPSGVGFARTPPEFLQPGDVVECEVEGIGRIRNRVVLGNE